MRRGWGGGWGFMGLEQVALPAKLESSFKGGRLFGFTQPIFSLTFMDQYYQHCSFF